MNPTTTLLIGLGVAVLVVAAWLGGIAYLRRTRERMSDESAATGTQIQHTEEQAHTLADWLARAAALPEGREPAGASDAPRDQGRLHELAARHFPSLDEPHPHLHLIGITGLEKRLVTWVCHETGLPNPFDALERVTGDPDSLRGAYEAWHDVHADVVAVVDRLCVATAALHETWTDPASGEFFQVLSDYLGELDALAADVQSTADTLRGLQAEAALAESTVVGLINLLIGSMGGYLFEAVATAGTLTPAVAAQAQIELTWVLKQIARVLAKLPSAFTSARHILQSVTGFERLQQARQRFQLVDMKAIAHSFDTAI